MKIHCYNSGRSRRSEGGMATLIFIALLAIMMILVMVETSSLARLHTEVRLLEQHHLKRLNNPTPVANTNNPTSRETP